MDCSPPGSSVHPWGFSRQEYWSGLSYPSPWHLPNPGIAPTQTQGLPHCRQIINHLSPQGRPRILEWVAYPFSRGSSWPRNWTGVSWIADRFFTSWATREAFREIACLHSFVTPHCGEGSCGEETFWRPQEKKASSSLHSRQASLPVHSPRTQTFCSLWLAFLKRRGFLKAELLEPKYRVLREQWFQTGNPRLNVSLKMPRHAPGEGKLLSRNCALPGTPGPGLGVCGWRWRGDYLRPLLIMMIDLRKQGVELVKETLHVCADVRFLTKWKFQRRFTETLPIYHIHLCQDLEFAKEYWHYLIVAGIYRVRVYCHGAPTMRSNGICTFTHMSP